MDLASARCTHGQWLEARDAYREAVSDTLAGAGGQRDAIMSGAIFGAYSGILPHVITSVEQAQQDRLHFVENLKILIRAAQTPAGLDQAIEAMESGAHLYLQKPISLDILEGEAILATARKLGKKVQVGTQRRSTPHLIEGKKNIVDAGLLGKISHVEMCCYYNMRWNANPPVQTRELWP